MPPEHRGLRYNTPMKQGQKTTTRDRLLDTAYRHFYEYGFYGSGLNAILSEAGVPKGSLYHHFPSKNALAMAVIQERIGPKMRDLFTPPFALCTTDLPAAVAETAERLRETGTLVTSGCPLNNLVQELAAREEAFTAVFREVFDDLTALVEAAIHRCLENGTLTTSDPQGLARYIFAGLQGCLMVGKTTGEVAVFDQCSQQLILSLKNLS